MSNYSAWSKEQKVRNINDLKIDVENDKAVKPLSDYSTTLKNVNFEQFECHFKNIEDVLIKKILEYKDGFIFGCVAWLTSEKILRAFSKCENVQIIVQKEDFLRPDLFSNKNNFSNNLRKMYSKIKFKASNFNCHEDISQLSYLGHEIEPIRCVGNHNITKNPASPRSHHKFLVFCKVDNDFKKCFDKYGAYVEDDEDGRYIDSVYTPESVWTGSFNFTKNATCSFENGVFMKDSSGKNQIIESFLREHHQIYALSEPLDWKTPWCAPEFRIGT